MISKNYDTGFCKWTQMFKEADFPISFKALSYDYDTYLIFK